MTKEEFNKLYLNKVVHCDAEEKANEFLKLANSFGCKWGIPVNKWDNYKQNTCYNVNGNHSITYCEIDYYKAQGYTIVEFEYKPKIATDTTSLGSLPHFKLYSLDLLMGKKTIPNHDPSQDIKLVYINDKKKQVCIKWNDGQTTKSTCSPNDVFDLNVGFAVAFTRRYFQSDKKLNKFLEDKMPKVKKPIKELEAEQFDLQKEMEHFGLTPLRKFVITNDKTNEHKLSLTNTYFVSKDNLICCVLLDKDYGFSCMKLEEFIVDLVNDLIEIKFI